MRPLLQPLMFAPLRVASFLFLASVTPVWGETSRSTALAITHVTIIDATGSPAESDMTLLIEGQRITGIGKTSELSVPEGAQVVDARGKFLIPGLVDMHVHTTWDPDFVEPLLLANGVTSVREMYAKDFPAIQQSRREFAAGQLLAPRILGAGPIVDGAGGPWPGSIIVMNAAEAQAAVDRVRKEGFEYVKVYSSLNREAYFAIAERAKRDGIPYAGHLPGAVTAVEASNAGQKSFEHLYGISLACSSREEELRKSVLNPPATPKGQDPRHAYFAEQQAELDSYDKEKADALYALLKKNGTWQVPTLVVMRNAALVYDPEYAKRLGLSAEQKYVPYGLQFMWSLALRFSGRPLPAEDLEASKRYFEWEVRSVGQMQKAGVGILAGTDTPNPFVYPGFALHEELALLVQGGLTPMEALQAATRNPALYFGKLDTMGTIEKGKLADLVLLNADPLVDIHNSKSIEAVVLDGKLISRANLDAMLVRVEGNRWRANPAALTLMGLVLHMMRKALLFAFAAILAIILGVFYWMRKRRSRRTIIH